jgi:hypothetical protein
MKRTIKLGDVAHEQAVNEVLKAAEKLADVMYYSPSFESLEITIRIDECGMITHYSQKGQYPTHSTEKDRIGLMKAISNAPKSANIEVKINNYSCDLEGVGILNYQYDQEINDLNPIVSLGYGTRVMVIPPSATEEEKTKMYNKMKWIEQ